MMTVKRNADTNQESLRDTEGWCKEENAMSKEVLLVTGAGQISMAIARRIG